MGGGQGGSGGTRTGTHTGTYTRMLHLPFSDLPLKKRPILKSILGPPGRQTGARISPFPGKEGFGVRFPLVLEKGVFCQKSLFSTWGFLATGNGGFWAPKPYGNGDLGALGIQGYFRRVFKNTLRKQFLKAKNLKDPTVLKILRRRKT